MRKFIKIMSLILTIFIFCNVSVYATRIDMEGINSYYENMSKRPERIDDVEAVLLKYGNLFPPMSLPNAKNPSGVPINTSLILEKGLIVYGGTDNAENQNKTDGIPVALGITYFGHDYSNMEHPENRLGSQGEVFRPAYKPYEDEKIKSDAVLKPFRSLWNEPEKVGERFLGEDVSKEEKIDMGHKMIDYWRDDLMANLENPIDPLRRAIVGGRGFEVRGKIVIKGTTQNFDNYDNNKFKNFVDDAVKEFRIAGIDVDTNTKGEKYQKAEPLNPYSITNIPSGMVPYGNSLGTILSQYLPGRLLLHLQSTSFFQLNT